MNATEDAEKDLFEFKPVSCVEVQKVIMAMPTNKAPGYDRVPISVVKDYLEHILPTLSGIINHSFSSSTFQAPPFPKHTESVLGKRVR